MRRWIFICGLMLGCHGFLSGAAAELYFWTDHNGVKHYSDTPVGHDVDAKPNRPAEYASIPQPIGPSFSCEPLAHLSYDGTPGSLKQIQKAALDAAKAGNMIAIHICRQTMYGLDDDSSLEKLLRSSAKPMAAGDMKRWCDLVEKKAKAGDPFFQTVLGILYHMGDGFPSASDKTLELWKAAADSGYHDAWCKLGHCFSTGQIVAKDIERAIFCYTRAGEKGSGNAWHRLGAIYFNGDGVPQDRPRGIPYFQKAAEKEFAPAMYDLGVCYDRGYGVAKDRAKAIQWFNRAALNGNFDARQYLLRLGEPIPEAAAPRSGGDTVSSGRRTARAVSEKPKDFKSVEICRACLQGIFQYIRLCEMTPLGQALQEDPSLLQSVSEDGWTPLAMAIASGCREMAKYLIDRGAAVDQRHPRLNFTPLHLAALTGQEEIAEYLIQKGADINALNVPPMPAYWFSRIVGTPLHTALYNAKPHMVEVLLTKGADPNIRDSEGRTLFELAVAINKREEAAAIYNRVGRPVPEVAPSVEELMSAISDCKVTSIQEKGIAKVQSLLKSNPELARQKDKNGGTPLHRAAFHEMDDLARQLITLGADVNARCEDGTTPLHQALDSKKLAETLVDHGAAVDSLDHDGRTPLHRVAAFPDCQEARETAELLVARGARKSIQDHSGQTPYDIAIANNSNELAKILAY